MKKYTNEELVEPKPGLHTFDVSVTQIVRVTLDGDKFTREMMAEFCDYMFPCFTLEDHAKHIAQLETRELLDSGFVEGYGPPSELGIKAQVIDTFIEVEQ